MGGTSLLTISIVTGNPTPGLTGVGLIDNLPAGLVVATPNNLTNNCGGTVTATAGSNAITLTGGALGPTTVCNFSLNVTGTTVGTKTNTTGAVTSDQGTGNTATASVSVGLLTPPTISKVFGAASIPVNGTTSLTFTITNPNAATSISGVGFTDTLPAGLVVATPSGAAGTCSTAAQGVVTAVAGSGSVSMATANLQPNQSCSLSVNVKSTQLGVLVNTTGTVTSLEAGPGNTATASITVLANLIPTLSPAALGGFALLLAGLGAVLARKAQTPVN